MGRLGGIPLGKKFSSAPSPRVMVHMAWEVMISGFKTSYLMNPGICFLHIPRRLCSCIPTFLSKGPGSALRRAHLSEQITQCCRSFSRPVMTSQHPSVGLWCQDEEPILFLTDPLHELVDSADSTCLGPQGAVAYIKLKGTRHLGKGEHTPVSF